MDGQDKALPMEWKRQPCRDKNNDMNQLQETLMSNFELSIQFTGGDTQKVNSDGFVVSIVKGIHNSSTDPKPLWVGFPPFENNTISWHDEYGIYASPNPLKPETVITASSILYPAKPGFVYPFADNVFGLPTGTAQPGVYAVNNNAGKLLTFGLLQGVTVNGKEFEANPVTAIAVQNQEEASISPSATISVFLHRKANLGTVVITTEGPVLTLDMAANPVQTIHYDGSRFASGPLG